MELILSAKPVSLKGLSEVDLKGVKAGKAYNGMTKKGVMAALGYPAAHETPSLDDNQWKYWRNRFRTVVVEFNTNGIVSNVRY
ncbi:MAG TPA: outer membrane protein assembly factor BamE [Proteobacteria bacterium]|nr:outer membrane protein assembly factor BamE [Pseudomonadota bacterium]